MYVSGREMLEPGTTCYRDVLDRLSQRLARVLGEVDKYNQQHQTVKEKVKEKEHVVGDDDRRMSLHSSGLPSWPPLRIRNRVDALRREIGDRPELQATLRRLDVYMRRLREDCLVDVYTQSCPEGGGVGAQEAAADGLVWLHRQMLRRRDESCELRRRAAQAYDNIQSRFDTMADVCSSVFRATAWADHTAVEERRENGNDGSNEEVKEMSDPAGLHALCRRNGERAQRMQSRLQKVLNDYEQIVDRTNLELCRVDLQVQAMERQSPHVDQMRFLYRGQNTVDVGASYHAGPHSVGEDG